MEMSLRLTLRLKLIFLIVSLLLVSLGAYLNFAIKLFVSDKTSYVFDTTLATTSYLAKDVRNTIANATENAFTFALIGKKKPALVRELFNLKTKILMFKIESRENIPVFIHPRLKELYGLSIDKLTKLSENFSIESRKDVETVNVSKELGTPAINLVIFNRYLGERYIYTLYLGDLVDSFKKESSFQNFLVDDRGEFIIGERKISKKMINQLLKSGVDTQSQKVKQGESQQNYLLSYTKMEELGLIIISRLSEEDAFRATDFLVKKSSIIGLVLLCLGIFAAIYFSSGITHPLEKLDKATKLISKGEYGTQIEIKSKDEVGSLAFSFNSMSIEILNYIEKVRKAYKKIDYMNKNLEKLVAKRTEELAEANSYLDAMINSLGQGLLVFDKNADCSPFYTNACLDIFDSEPNGMSYFDLIRIQDSKERGILERWTHNLFLEKIPFKSLASLGPKQIVFGENIEDPDYKYVSLEYFPMRRETQRIDNIVVVATDKTNEIKAEARFQKEREETLQMVFIHENKRQFLNYLNETEQFKTFLTRQTRGDLSKNLDKIKITLHSLKGSSGVYNLNDLYKVIDAAELSLEKLDVNKEIGKIDSLVKLVIKEIENEVTKVKKKFQSFLGQELVDGIPRYEKRLDLLKEHLSKLEGLGINDLTESFKSKIYRVPVKDFFKDINYFIQDLANQLNKEVLPVVLSGGDLLIDPVNFTSLLQSLVHLYRNILDHGIEEPHIRDELGKKEEGTIKISFLKIDDQLQLSILDDGAGISIGKLKKAMIKNNYETLSLEKRDEDIIYHIFDANLSTKTRSTDISGRGVGMSAIRDEVLKLNGKIKIESKESKGTIFFFEVPYA